MPTQQSDVARLHRSPRARAAALVLTVASLALVVLTGAGSAQASPASQSPRTVEVGRLIVPVSDLVSSRVGVASTTTELIARAVTPPPAPSSACPAPEAEFVDSWGFARSGGRRHKGVDMMAPYGSPVLAPVAGTIRTSNSALGGLAFYLDGTEEGNEYFGGHLATLDIRSGWVEAGTLLGTVGTSGNASSPHLHFEVKLAGVGSVNPYPYTARWCAAPVPTPIAFPS